jgi:hypothetical protein
MQKLKGDKGSMSAELGDWFCDHSGEVHSHNLIAVRIRLIRRKRLGTDVPVTQDQLMGWITRTRAYLETEKGVTLFNIKGLGYKVADASECALYSMFTLRRVVRLADRTYRLVDIVERKYIPSAFKKVFLETEGGIRQLSRKGRRFLLTWEKLRKGD